MLLGGGREGEREEQVGGGVLPRDGDPHGGRVEGGGAGAGHQERADPQPERAARLQEGIAAGHPGQHAVADLGEVQPALERPLVEGLDVLVEDLELEPLEIDQPVVKGSIEACSCLVSPNIVNSASLAPGALAAMCEAGIGLDASAEPQYSGSTHSKL